MSELAKLFPAAYVPHVHRARPNSKIDEHRASTQAALSKPTRTLPLPTRYRMILTLELRGRDKSEIAELLGLRPNTLTRITNSPRYIEAREALLGAMDQEFANMKPDAMQALRRGLNAPDANTALHASETWMKAAGFMQYGKGQGQQGVTAEDVAAQLLQVNITINTDKKD